MRIKTSLMASLLFVAGASFAQTPDVAPKNQTTAQIISINEQIALLQTQLAELEVRAKIAAKKADIDKYGIGAGTPVPTETEVQPVVRSISGIDDKLTAVVSLGGGITQVVSKNSRVGSWTVMDIKENEVVMKNGVKIVRLGFGLEPNTPKDDSKQAQPTVQRQ